MNALREIPTDPLLRHLSLALDPQRMLDIFKDRICNSNTESKTGFQLIDCRIERIKYKPRKNCLVFYRLMLENQAGRKHEQILSGRVYEPGGSASRFFKAQKEDLVDTEIIDPLLHFPDLDMVLWAFPNERKMRGLPYLNDPDFLQREIIPELMADRWGPGWKLLEMTHTLVHYKPEDSCTVCVNSLLGNIEIGETRSWILYGKTFYDDQGKDIQNIMSELWSSSYSSQVGIKMARPLGFLSEYNMVWQEGIPGTPLFLENQNDPKFLRALEQSAKTIAKLHNTRIICHRTKGTTEVVETLKEMEILIGTSCPSIHPTLSRVVDWLVNEAPDLEEDRMVTLHGDLHLKNLLVDDDKIYLIDLDAMSLGTPFLDLGSFCAGIITLSMVKGDSWEIAEKKYSAFIDRYRIEAGWPVTEKELKWHIIAALIHERAFRSLKGLKAGRLELVKVLINIADALSRGLQPGEYSHHVKN